MENLLLIKLISIFIISILIGYISYKYKIYMFSRGYSLIPLISNKKRKYLFTLTIVSFFILIILIILKNQSDLPLIFLIFSCIGFLLMIAKKFDNHDENTQAKFSYFIKNHKFETLYCFATFLFISFLFHFKQLFINMIPLIGSGYFEYNKFKFYIIFYFLLILVILNTFLTVKNYKKLLLNKRCIYIGLNIGIVTFLFIFTQIFLIASMPPMTLVSLCFSFRPFWRISNFVIPFILSLFIWTISYFAIKDQFNYLKNKNDEKYIDRNIVFKFNLPFLIIILGYFIALQKITSLRNLGAKLKYPSFFTDMMSSLFLRSLNYEWFFLFLLMSSNFVYFYLLKNRRNASSLNNLIYNLFLAFSFSFLFWAIYLKYKSICF